MTNRTDAAPTAGGFTFFLLALAAGLGAANLYYAQPLVALIGADIGLDETLASLVVTIGQVGYILGLLLLVPLGDIVENRRLIGSILICAAVGLGLAFVATEPALFLFAALVFGVGSVVAQVAVPFAAHLARPEERGRKVGSVVSGLMTGILLARPVSSLVAHFLGWRAVFLLAALLILALAVGLRIALPQRRSATTTGGGASYGALVASLWPLMRSQPILRRRAAYQAAMFCVFTLFWTAVPLLLASPQFGFGQEGIAIFALAGAASVFISPLAGWIADRGWSRAATGAALLLAIAGFLVTELGVATSSVVVLAIGAIVLDCAATANLVFGQRAIFMLAPEIRSRLNALYIATFFLGGALGSALASPLYEIAGWGSVTLAGSAIMILALLYYATEFRRG